MPHAEPEDELTVPGSAAGTGSGCNQRYQRRRDVPSPTRTTKPISQITRTTSAIHHRTRIANPSPPSTRARRGTKRMMPTNLSLQRVHPRPAPATPRSEIFTPLIGCCRLGPRLRSFRFGLDRGAFSSTGQVTPRRRTCTEPVARTAARSGQDSEFPERGRCYGLRHHLAPRTDTVPACFARLCSEMFLIPPRGSGGSPLRREESSHGQARR
jgi:hypothetical protein